VIVNVPPCTSSGFNFFERARREIVDRAAQPEQVLLIRVLDHRHEQSLVERDGDPEVDVFLVDDLVPVDGRVEDREGTKGVNHGFRNQARVGQLRAGAFVFTLLLVAELRELAEVHFVHRVHVR
jgi:hypothetical protein